MDQRNCTTSRYSTAAQFYCEGGMLQFFLVCCAIALVICLCKAYLYHQELWLRGEQRRVAAQPGALQILRNIRDTLQGRR